MVTLSLMVLLTIIALGLLSLNSISLRTTSSAQAMVTARANARMALILAIGDMQKSAGPDQRVTATASILGSSDNPYAKTTTAVNGKKHWAGVWDTSNFSPANPDSKTFVRWLVSGSETAVNDMVDAGIGAGADDVVIFEGVDSSGNPDPNGPDSVKVPKVEIVDATSGNKSYYAYWVEDESVKADLAWKEGSFSDAERKQAARLSATPGPDHGVFGGPFASGVSYPLKKGSGYIGNLEKSLSPADMPLVMGSGENHSAWLKANRHNMGMHSRGVLADVKNGGLRRDLSLAFEMDGAAESENATLFNQQIGEFVAGNDSLAAVQNAPGMTTKDRFLFRDFQTAGNVFSGHISLPETVARGPSWWLLRDYANLYKRLKASNSGYSLDARAYFPNRTTRGEIYDNLFDIHAYHQNFAGDPKIKVQQINRESNGIGGYAFQPARASYAPVLLGVNAIYSLVYSGNNLQLVVDPFFIIWNPYDIQIKAPRFAITLENGLAGGVRFKLTDPAGNEKLYGKPSKYQNGNGSDTSFSDYAKRKSGVNANLSYLISNLSMKPGEVQIYSPPNETDRSNTANVLNDELMPGMNYDATTSGIFFDEFPLCVWNGNRWVISSWDKVSVNPAQSGQHKIDVLFNITSQVNYAITNNIEINLPASGIRPDQLTGEDKFGDHIQGKEFRLNLGGNQNSRNVDTGQRGFSFSYTFSELGATKQSFGILSMLTLPTDHAEADTAAEVFSQLNVTAAVSTWTEVWHRAPFNMVVKSVAKDGINNLINEVGIDFDAIGSGLNGFYGKSYETTGGDTAFPLLSIHPYPLHSLVQLSSANIGTRLFEPTHAIGNSWKPPYIAKNSIYDDTTGFYGEVRDTSWLVNDALFDRYYLSGVAPAYKILANGYAINGSSVSTGIKTTLQSFYGDSPELAKANPVLGPYVPTGKTADEIVTELTPSNDDQEGYKKIGAYSLIDGAFNVNSTSVDAWSALLRGNKDLAIESLQSTTDSATGTPFPLGSTASDTSSNHGWEKFSRISDSDIQTLAEKIVDEVKKRGPFMSIADFVNRRITDDSRSSQGAIQEAIERANINGNQSSGIRAATSDTTPNYSDYPTLFPYSDAASVGARNNATGIPLEVNQANILLPIASRLSARSDTFRIRGYGEVRDSAGSIIAQATCEAVVQRLPEYLDAETDPNNNEPWDDDTETPTLNTINQTYGRKFKITSFRWLHQTEI